jgi:hypothetical protein
MVESCASDEVCDAAEGLCVPMACVPNLPVCSGDWLTTCLPDGSGPAAGGTKCPAMQTCSNGACHDGLWLTDFESNSLSGWKVNTQGTFEISSPGAAGTQNALKVDIEAKVVQGGASFAFAEKLKPSKISFWLRIPEIVPGHGGGIFFDTTVARTWLGLSYENTQLSFFDGTTLTLLSSSWDSEWHYFELRDIDWSTNELTVFGDGILKTVQFPKMDGVASVAVVAFGAASTTPVTFFADEIMLFR